MTAIVENVQKQGVESSIVTLYDLEYADGVFAYFTPTIDEDLTSIQFRDSGGTVRTYNAIPIQLEGFDVQSDGAISRPSMTVANIESTFKDALGGLGFEDLIGRRITRRTTQEKYLVGNSGDSTPPVEFPSITYVIDRIASKSIMGVTFELAAPFDLAGIKLPRRVVIGGACPWKYQGASSTLAEVDKEGGCSWRLDNKINIGGTDYLLAANESDEMILLKTALTGAATGTTLEASGSYSQNSFYFTATQLQRYDSSGVLSTVNDINTRQYWLCIRSTSTGPSNTNTAFRKVRPYQTFSASGTYYGYKDKGFNDIVLQNGAFWRAQRTTVTGYGGSQTSGNISENDFWTRADRCGKQITSCRLRFQAKLHPSVSGAFHALQDNKQALPFGGFPGVVQRRR
ncbi:MAG: phage minor tail protein L [Candidatus Pelagibacter sp.]|nr:phage minor tail protein L [Candidatus Pelagibacter sp.]|tara:strand:- start:362 stop:1561 length:1200 start_codon:yes stop_codon:yes gene_type:complete